MSGHSKWANTKHRKEAQDIKRNRIFAKIIRELVVSSRLGGCDPTSNPRLRTAIDKALSNNMTRETLNRAIARGMDDDESINMETITYEGYGPGGIAIMVECLSDNRNRTVSELRQVFSKGGGNLSTDGSVAYLFKKKGIISFAGIDEEVVMEASIGAGAEDIVIYEDGKIDVYTSWKKIGIVRSALENVGLKSDCSKIAMIPSTLLRIDSETESRFLHFINILKNCDDVQKVYHNGQIQNGITHSF